MIPQRIFFTFAISLISFDQIAENNEKKNDRSFITTVCQNT